MGCLLRFRRRPLGPTGGYQDPSDQGNLLLGQRADPSRPGGAPEGYPPHVERGTGGPGRPALEGTLVRLRAPEPTDPVVLNSLFSDPEVLAGLTVPMPQSVQGFRDYLEWVRGQATTRFFIVERLEDRQPIGGCSLEQIETRARTAALGIWIGRPFWDRGYGTDTVRTLCRFGFRHMNLQRIELNVFATNPRGRRAYEKVGFVLEGTRRRSGFIGGRHVDAFLMGLLADELID